MLDECITSCPEELWVGPQPEYPYWQVVYHALFYAHLYLQASEATFAPWAKHRGAYHRLGAEPAAPVPDAAPGYTQTEMLEYLAFCRDEVKQRLAETDFAAPSGFSWLPFDKFELQIYTIRHLQLHAGELGARLFDRGIETRWIGAGNP
ncbi:MAG: DinB family protein [Anaerolineales bacterium]|nr:DinB family protein [Anaerolineales bacterium]